MGGALVLARVVGGIPSVGVVVGMSRKAPTPIPPGTVKPEPPPAPPRTDFDAGVRAVNELLAATRYELADLVRAAKRLGLKR